MTALGEFVQRYGPQAGADGPVLMVREVFGVEPDDWQEDTMRAYGGGVRGISIAACHGPGKTAVAAWLVWHMLLTRFPQKTVATAPSKAQLEDALVVEVKKWGSRLPDVLVSLFEFKASRIELKAAPSESFFSARTARAETPEALQGVHSENVLLIADEASGVPEAIFEAAAGSMSGGNATTLLLSNPVRSSGFFYDTHHKLRDLWFTKQISYKDSPRVTEDFANDIARRYGENSNAYRIRVLGQFPLADDDTIIPWDHVISATQRDIVVPPGLRPVWGVDIARFGNDSNALVPRNRLAVMPEIEVWQGLDLMQTAGRIKRRYDEAPLHLKPTEILIDVIGLGAGVVDRLWEQGLPVRGINVSESAALTDKYRNLRTELWFQAREWLSLRQHVLPPEGASESPTARLIAELPMLKYAITSSGKLMAESKADLKKRGHQSPNVADAMMLTFAGEPAGLLHGSAGSLNYGTNWQQPITRNLRTV